MLGGSGDGASLGNGSDSVQQTQSKNLFKFLSNHHSKVSDCVIVGTSSSSSSSGSLSNNAQHVEIEIPAIRCLVAACSSELEKKVLESTKMKSDRINLNNNSVEIGKKEIDELINYSIGAPKKIQDVEAALLIAEKFKIPILAEKAKKLGAIGKIALAKKAAAAQTTAAAAAEKLVATAESGENKKASSNSNSSKDSTKSLDEKPLSSGGGIDIGDIFINFAPVKFLLSKLPEKLPSGLAIPLKIISFIISWIPILNWFLPGSSSNKRSKNLDPESNADIDNSKPKSLQEKIKLNITAFFSSFFFFESIAFVTGILCWKKAWYFNLERGGLFMDDVMIKRNHNVVDPQFDWDRLIRTDYWGLEMFDPQVWTHKSFRPVTVYSFRFDYQNFGFDSYAFHRHNIVLHALSGFLLGYVSYSILKVSPFFSAYMSHIFLTHPVHTESLLYIVGRADPQCTMFIFLAVLAYAKMIRLSDPISWIQSQSIKRGTSSLENVVVTQGNVDKALATTSLIKASFYMFLALFLVTVSGLCKEIGFTVFGLLVMLEGYFVYEGGNRTICMIRTATVLIVGFVVVYWRWNYTQGTKIARMDPYSNPIAAHDDVWQQGISYWYIHGRYAELLVWPYFLNYDYSMNAVPLILSIKDMRLLLPAMCYVVLALGIYFTMHQFHTLLGRASGFGLGLFALSFFPMSNILFPVGTLIAERLLYIPSVGYVIVTVSFLNMCWDRICLADKEAAVDAENSTKVQEDQSSDSPMDNESDASNDNDSDDQNNVIIIEKATAWGTKTGSTTKSGYKKNPFLSTRFRRFLGKFMLVFIMSSITIFYWYRCYTRIDDWKDAETITEVDGIAQPWSGRTAFNIANLYLGRKDYPKALEAYIRAIKSDPEERDSMPLYHAGQIYIYYGDWAQAENYLKKAVGGFFSPLTLAEEEVFHDYGMALWHNNKAPESIYNLQASIITNPNFAKGYNNLACAQVLYGLDLKNQEMINQGLGALEKAIQLAPDMGLYWRNAAVLLKFIGDQPASQNAWQKFGAYDPSALMQGVPENCVWEFYFR